VLLKSQPELCENNQGQVPVNSQTLLIQELLPPVSIDQEVKMIDKNRQKPPLQAYKKPKTGYFYPLKVPLIQ
jgi:hypothetical protein